MVFFLGCFVAALLYLFPANLRGPGAHERRPYRERMLRRYRTLEDLLSNYGAPRGAPPGEPAPHAGQHAAPQALQRRPVRRRLNEEDIISHLRTRICNRHEGEGDQTPECSICREPIDDGQTMAELDCACQFSYHFSCMRTWLMENNSCPTCRQRALEIPIINL